MNPHNAAFELHLNKVSKALNQLIHFGCAIKALSITDQGDVIDILPPLNEQVSKRLNGYEVTIKGDTRGRQYEYNARMHGCTIRWQSAQNTQTITTR